MATSKRYGHMKNENDLRNNCTVSQLTGISNSVLQEQVSINLVSSKQGKEKKNK